MATWIPNQPVYFGSTDLCNDDEITVDQIVDNTDTTQFQFALDPCVSAQQMIPDPVFGDINDYVLQANWSMAYNTLCLQGNSPIGATVTTGTGGSTILSIFTLGKYYQVNITVDSISIGGSVNVLIGSDIIGVITEIGSYTFYGFATNEYAVYGYPLVITSTVAGTNICLSSLTAYEILTNFIFAFYNKSGVYQTQLSYAAIPTAFNFSEDTVTVSVDWSAIGLSNGCFYICLLDPCENTNGQNAPATITNCTFTGSKTGWTGDTWTYAANEVTCVTGNGSLIQTNVFNSFTTTYSITIVISILTGSGLLVYFGTNLVATLTTTGTHVVTGIPASTFSLELKNGSGTVTVREACANSVAISAYTCNQQSNNFSLANYSNSCTQLINACNNENGMGFNFNGSGFTPRLRLNAKLKHSQYPTERTIFEDSAGTKSVIYFNSKKAKELAIDLQPEYIHDFLRLLGGFDNFYIGGELYFVEDDEYSVEYSDVSDDLGKVKMLVSKRTQNVKNINCSDSQNVCNLGADYLLRADDLGYRIVQTDGSGILING